MPVSPARKIAHRILIRLESGRGFAVEMLQRPEVFALKESDRHLTTELVMGVLRWRGELDFQIGRLSARTAERLDSQVLTILRMGVYQIRFLDRVPKHAVVNEAVELTKAAHKRSAAGLVNAVLRRCEPAREGVLRSDFEHASVEHREAIRRSFPAWLLRRWERLTATTLNSGEGGALRLAHSSLAPPRTTLRAIDPDFDLQAMQRELEAEGVPTHPCQFAARGLRVQSGHIQNTRPYREGRVVIQDEASQLVAELVSPESAQRVLDLCAAPGIKAGQLAHALGTGTLIACDRSRTRLGTMGKLLPRWLPSHVRLSIVQLDATREFPFKERFDRILVDAPCSGTGTVARNPEIKWRLRPDDINRLAGMQALMLRNALTALTSGGLLVYATCSLEPEENEGVVGKVLRAEPGFRVLTARELAAKHPRLIPLFNSQGYFWTRPDQHSMEGFNAAVITRV